MILKGKVFLVTGAGSGMGRELVLGLVKKGAKVAAVDIREENLVELEKSIDDKNQIATFVADISDKKVVDTLPNKVITKLSAIDGIINNAGIIQPFVRVNDLDFAAIERVMNVNFYGLLYMTKAFLPELLKRAEGYVVNVSSMGGFLPVPGQSVYGASKAAVKLLTEGLYAELLETNVHVSIVFPGAVATNITANSGVKIEMPKGEKVKEYKALSAPDAARIIISGIENNKPQIFVGGDSRFMNKLYRFHPVFATKFIAKQMKSLLSNSAEKREKVAK